jgi:hypothetical protein
MIAAGWTRLRVIDRCERRRNDPPVAGVEPITGSMALPGRIESNMQQKTKQGTVVATF